MNKHIYRRLEGDPLPPDESWWAAVMAEEEEKGAPTPKAPAAPKQESKPGGAAHAGKQPNIDWERAQEYYDLDQTLCLKVSGYNRGGLLVEGSGLQGFVPISHLVELNIEKLEGSIEVSEMLAPYVGKLLTLKVIECDRDRGRVVLSERAALAEPGQRNLLLETIRSGDIVHGHVTNITDFGVFVDLGGVEGLIHVSELSWGRVRHPSDAVQMGEQVEAYVIHVEKDRSRVALSLKRLFPNPWETAAQRYKPGMVIEAEITSVVPFGAFARLEEGLDGLIHISEMSTSGKKVYPSDILCEGQKVKVRVLQVDPSRQRLGLSLCCDDSPEE